MTLTLSHTANWESTPALGRQKKTIINTSLNWHPDKLHRKPQIRRSKLLPHSKQNPEKFNLYFLQLSTFIIIVSIPEYYFWTERTQQGSGHCVDRIHHEVRSTTQLTTLANGQRWWRGWRAPSCRVHVSLISGNSGTFFGNVIYMPENCVNFIISFGFHLCLGVFFSTGWIGLLNVDDKKKRLFGKIKAGKCSIS